MVEIKGGAPRGAKAKLRMKNEELRIGGGGGRREGWPTSNEQLGRPGGRPYRELFAEWVPAA